MLGGDHRLTGGRTSALTLRTGRLVLTEEHEDRGFFVLPRRGSTPLSGFSMSSTQDPLGLQHSDLQRQGEAYSLTGSCPTSKHEN